MMRFTVVAAVLYLLGALISRFSPQSIFGMLEILGLAGLIVSVGYYGYRLFIRLKRRLLWKVRNRIIVSFAFIGILPVTILLILSWISFTLIFRQLGALYLESEVQSIQRTLQQVNERILVEFLKEEDITRGRLEHLFSTSRETLVMLAPELEKTFFMAMRAGTSLQSLSGARAVSGPVIAASIPEGIDELELATPTIPTWLADGFTGLVSDSGKLSFRSALPLKRQRETIWLLAELPFDDDLIRHLHQKTSIDLQLFHLTQGEPEAGLTFWRFFSTENELWRLRWIHFFRPLDWSSGEPLIESVQGVLLAVPVRAIYDHLFEVTDTGAIGRVLMGIILGLGILFVLVEVTSLLIGIAIAGRITGSIANIHAGTQNIQQGRLDFRIPAGDRDQLDEMAAGFNRMAANIVGLMRQVSEKERLDKEIEIAREVQTRLFPQKLPQVRNIQLAGTCLPARQVSGDYYDFIPHGDGVLDLIISDISGKGISAALLMASLQSSIRAIVGYRSDPEAMGGQIARSVTEINRHLYHQTAADKFATLVLARFNAVSMTLTYCNAGHNFPLHFSQGRVSRLDKGGTIVGLFETWDYEEETVQLSNQDVVVFYTDGITEAENNSREQYGEQRLVEVVQSNLFLTADDLQQLIFDEVFRWSSDTEQGDDMTLVILKVEP